MQLPPQYIPHLDHRITVLMSFTLRRDAGWFGPDHGELKNLGDVYRASLEGAGIMLRMLIEFVGVQADLRNPGKLTKSNKHKRDVVLGEGLLGAIPPVDRASIGSSMECFLARMHEEASKRTAHPAFHKFTLGLDPKDLRKATKWIVSEIWERCYKPDAITVHRDIFSLLPMGHWEGIPFQPAQ